MIRKTKNGMFECTVIYDGHKPITAIGSTQAIAWRACIEALKEVVGGH